MNLCREVLVTSWSPPVDSGGAPHLPKFVVSRSGEPFRIRSWQVAAETAGEDASAPAANATRTGRSAVAVSRSRGVRLHTPAFAT